ncbi:Gfo/Idh/MocA family protein [Paenibacillus cremeus]|uniref:Gfo/Idh/MocA family oxidoreductase n=1 Tax=Paenibacillus cremeus TaxID=2163881 RepID=A0A559K7C2_9BACL|nr:Gfo/Idh/MocA family oxidoreductase [Paenibacillus cremeus]TVY08029.1 Gfo/Idh/MocA family oxidoreductase [Paenibacillus cremeus]
MERIRLGMIGLGRFAELHARIYSRLPQVEVTAICDSNLQRHDRFKQWFPKARCYINWEEMLTVEHLDAVDILTPEHLHEEPVRDALRAGAHVFVEKPLANTPEAAYRLVQESIDCGRLLMTGHVLRFDHRYIAVKEQVSSGAMGMIRSIYAKRNNGKAYFPLYNRVSPVFILGIHDIDLMRWYMEDEVAEVYAVNSFPDGSMAPDLNGAILRFGRGGIGILECNWLLPEGALSFQDIRMEITAEQGCIHIQDPDASVLYNGGVKSEVPSLTGLHETHGRLSGALFDELAHFVDCVVTGTRSTILQPEDALQAVRIAWAIERSAALGRPVKLSTMEETES